MLAVITLKYGSYIANHPPHTTHYTGYTHLLGSTRSLAHKELKHLQYYTAHLFCSHKYSHIELELEVELKTQALTHGMTQQIKPTEPIILKRLVSAVQV